MKKKIILLISVFISASILTVVGGILSVSANARNAQNAAATQVSLSDAAKIAQYQNLLAQANQTINKANAEISQLQAQLQQQGATPTAASYAILPDQAAAIAMKTTGAVLQGSPRLVNYNGNAAYEVTFSNGTVYVDANTGKILYNGVQTVSTITSQQAAQIAMNYTGNSNVSGVDSGLYNSQPAFRVTFQNGEVVYVDMQGTILAVQLPSSVNNSSNPTTDEAD